MNRVIASRQGGFGRVCLNAFRVPLAPHAHAEAHLVLAIDGPPVSMRVAGIDVALDAYRAAAVGPLLPHDVRVGPEAASVPSRALVLYLDDPALGRLASRPTDEGGPGVAIDGATRALAGRVADALDRAPRERRVRGDGAAGKRERSLERDDETDVDADLAALVTRCGEALRAGGGAGAGPHRGVVPVDARVHAAVLRLRDAVATLGAGAVRPDDVARQVGLSRPHFYRLFREHVGLTPGEYLDALRADAAIARVASTARSMTDIGEELGFASQASFTRFFRERVGVPPTAYRRGSPAALDTSYLRLSGIRRRALRARIGSCAVT